jgi:hypothetical protein
MPFLRSLLSLPSWLIAKRKRRNRKTGETIYLSQLEKLSKEEWDSILSKDPGEAARWIYSAATYGNIDAQLHWAQMLLDGIGTERDPEGAFRWFGIAARSKRADAINMLGRCHELGWGTPVDFGKAAEHYQEAAAKSSDWARFNLGCLLLEGKGVGRNVDEAFRLFRSAVEQGHVKSLWSGVATKTAGDVHGIGPKPSNGFAARPKQAISGDSTATHKSSSNRACRTTHCPGFVSLSTSPM